MWKKDLTCHDPIVTCNSDTDGKNMIPLEKCLTNAASKEAKDKKVHKENKQK